MTKEEQIEHRITKLEVIVESVLTNHIPHIESDISDMKTQNKRILFGMFFAVLGLAANLIVLLVK